MRRDTKEVLAELVEKLKEKLDSKKVAATSAGEHQRGVGLTHICARSRRGKFTVQVRTMRKRLRRGLTAVAEWCQEHRHAPVDEQQKALNAKLRGHYQYYGRPTNSQSLVKFYRGVVRIWRKWLNRRTRGNRMTWERYTQLVRRYPLLPPRIRHVWT